MMEPLSDLLFMRRAYVRSCAVTAAILGIALAALAQRLQIRHGENPNPTFPARAEFHFIRVEYTDLPQYHRRWGYASRGATGEGWWMVDWPDADDHFSMGVHPPTPIATSPPRPSLLTSR